MVVPPPICKAPDPNPVHPRLLAPPGATDTHMHIFGPERRYPLVAQRSFTPPDASVEGYVHLHQVLGLSRAVLVQPSSYGTDNRRQLDAAQEMSFPTRLVVVVPPSISDNEMERLHRLGARAIRFILTQPSSVSVSELETMAARISCYGWHLDLMLSPKNLLELAPRLARLECDYVVDHMSDIRAELGVEQAEFRTLLNLAESGHCWIKLSAGYHMSDEAPPYRDVIPFIHKLVAHRCDRLLWGTDWPHVNVAGGMPNTTELFDLLVEWLPSDVEREQVLVSNPAYLYGF